MSEKTENGSGSGGGEGGGGGGRRRRRRRGRRRNNNSGASDAPKSSGSKKGGSGSRGGRSGGRGGNRSGGGGGGRNNQRRRSGGNRRSQREQFGGREPSADHERPDGPLELNAFELFSTYYLGVTPDNGYRKPNAKEVARRFDRSVNELQDALKKCGMDKESLKGVDFDFSLAQLDVKVAPEGIDKKEIARVLFDEFTELNPNFVDWSEEVVEEVEDDDEEYEDSEAEDEEDSEAEEEYSEAEESEAEESEAEDDDDD